MSTFIRLNTQFNNPALPVVTDYVRELQNTDSLFAWYNADEGNYSIDVNGEVTAKSIVQAPLLRKPVGRTASPLVQKSAIDNHNAFAFDSLGSDKGGFVSSEATFPADVTIFAVFYDDRPANDANAAITGYGTASVGPLMFYSSGSPGLDMAAPGGLRESYPIPTRRWVGAMISTDQAGSMASAISDNWSAMDISTGGTGFSTRSLFVGENGETLSGFIGLIAEVVVLDGLISDPANSDYQLVTAYLSAKYNL